MKKWIALVMSVVLCLAFFTACKKEATAADAAQEDVMAEPLLGEDLEAAKKEIEGTWADAKGEFTMWISFRGDVCNVDIDRLSDNEKGEYWHFSGDLAKADGYRLVALDCSKYQTTKENGFSQELVYEDGTATIVLKDGQITWEDETEKVAEGVIFLKK